jgi:hypothetical protein
MLEIDKFLDGLSDKQKYQIATHPQLLKISLWDNSRSKIPQMRIYLNDKIILGKTRFSTREQASDVVKQTLLKLLGWYGPQVRYDESLSQFKIPLEDEHELNQSMVHEIAKTLLTGSWSGKEYFSKVRVTA